MTQHETPPEEERSFLYAAQPEVNRKVDLTMGKHDTSQPVISERDAAALFDTRCELERARSLYPPFRSLASAVVEIQHRSNQLGGRLVNAFGQMDDEVKRKLIQTAAMCIRALTENE